MKSEWTKMKLSDIADFNPRETIKKGEIAKKISMDVLRPFYRDVPYYTEECFSGGTKFRNGDTIMARITPCLENGKTAQVSILNDGEVGFGSTEYIVFRAKEGIADPPTKSAPAPWWRFSPRWKRKASPRNPTRRAAWKKRVTIS